MNQQRMEEIALELHEHPGDLYGKRLSFYVAIDGVTWQIEQSADKWLPLTGGRVPQKV